ncbi:MAG TPA: hypothetical protein VGH33_27450 [Isosphaeraceae bacterium]
MQLIIEKGGQVRAIYGEEIELTVLGQARITRASHVEPDEKGLWWVDLAPVGGPTLGPFDRRSESLEAELNWLQANWLLAADSTSGPEQHE